MPLPTINTNQLLNNVEAEYPIGKYKSGEYKLCYICKKKFYVGQFFVNSSKEYENRDRYREYLKNEFGEDVANARVARMSKPRPQLVHYKCEPDSDSFVNAIVSAEVSCICCP